MPRLSSCLALLALFLAASAAPAQAPKKFSDVATVRAEVVPAKVVTTPAVVTLRIVPL